MAWMPTRSCPARLCFAGSRVPERRCQSCVLYELTMPPSVAQAACNQTLPLPGEASSSSFSVSLLILHCLLGPKRASSKPCSGLLSQFPSPESRNLKKALPNAARHTCPNGLQQLLCYPIPPCNTPGFGILCFFSCPI